MLRQRKGNFPCRQTFFEGFKGALTEQYVCQQLVSEYWLVPCCWSAEHSTGKIDFLIQDKNRLVAIEVKTKENLRTKSLRAFKDRYPPMSLRFASTCRDTASRTGCATCHCTRWATHRCGTNDTDTQQKSNAPILCRALHPTLSECLAEYPSSATMSTALSSIPRLRGSRGYFGA